MSTAGDLIKLALQMAGATTAGLDPTATEMSNALMILNSMLASWNQKRWLVYHLVDVACQADDAKDYYTVWSGGDLQITRPDNIQACYVRQQPQNSTVSTGQNNTIDYDLTIIQTHEEYASIRLKALRSFPSVCFYDPAPTFGILHIWPLPTDQYEIHILVKEQLGQFATTASTITLPPEYFEALLYNLAGRLQIFFRMPVDPAIKALAEGALHTIRTANHRVGNLKMPAGLGRARGGPWPNHGIGGVYQGTFTLDEDVLG